MIKLNENFSCKRDNLQWLLYQKKPKGTNPFTGEVSKKDSVKTTYHSNMGQCLNVAIDRTLGECESLEEVRKMLLDSRELVLEACAAATKANG